MLWNPQATLHEEPFLSEAELEKCICEAAPVLFGPNRVYLDLKKKIGAKGKTQNIPDGYLLDLSSAKQPKLFVVEIELASHDPLKHIAVQILEFSLSFETSPHTVKSILKDAISDNKNALELSKSFSKKNGFDNVDVLLENIVYGKDRFNALVIIDEMQEELETVLMSRFRFPVETMTFSRFKGNSGEYLYQFQPFLYNLTAPGQVGNHKEAIATVDISDIDTIVVPAREEGFLEVFLNENRWWAIRIHASMIDKIKHIAAYRVAPESAITHVADVDSIDQWENSNKYVLNFKEPAKQIKPIPLVPKGLVKAPQGPRYTNFSKLLAAKNMDEVFSG